MVVTNFRRALAGGLVHGDQPPSTLVEICVICDICGRKSKEKSDFSAILGLFTASISDFVERVLGKS
jgi:hypothetical protein